MIELLDIKQVAEYLHVTPNTVRKRVASGHFPKPITRPREKYLWVKEHVEEWLRNQIEKSDEKTRRIDAVIRNRAKIKETAAILKRHGIDWNPDG